MWHTLERGAVQLRLQAARLSQGAVDPVARGGGGGGGVALCRDELLLQPVALRLELPTPERLVRVRVQGSGFGVRGSGFGVQG